MSKNDRGRRQSLHGMWSSRLAFVLAVSGSAVGLGNIWRFPYIAGENGGGAFVLLYLGCVIVVGLPIMMSEILIGRRGRRNPVATLTLLGEEEGHWRGWGVAGALGVVTGFLILSFYSVIGGWVVAYVFRSAAGAFSSAAPDRIADVFAGMAIQPPQTTLYSCSTAQPYPHDPDAKVGSLSVGQQQRVEILKALYRDARILILDEPTAVLAPKEVESLFATLKTMVAEGLSIIFISHKLNEVMAVADRVAVLRQGKLVAELPIAEASKESLAHAMVGRAIALPQREPLARRLQLAVEPGDIAALGVADLVALVAERLLHRNPEVPGVDELDLPPARLLLAVREDPDVGRDAGVVEELVGQGDHGLEPVVLDDPAADVALALAGVAGEERAAVVHLGDAAAERRSPLHLREHVGEEQHLAVARAGDVRRLPRPEAPWSPHARSDRRSFR